MRVMLLVLALLLAGCANNAEPSEAVEAPPIVIDDVGEAPAPPAETATAAPTPEQAEPIRAKVISDEDREWEPSGAINPTDSDHYVVAYRSASHLAFSVRVTFDAGQTWSSSRVPLVGDDTWYHHGDAVIFFSPEGRLYVGGLGGFDTTPPPGADDYRQGRSIIVAESLDGGLSWEPPVTVAQGGGSITTYGDVEQWDDFTNQDRPWFSAGADGVILAAWNELGHDGARTVISGASTTPYDGNEFQFSISRDGGATWTAPETLSHGGWPGALVLSDGTFALGHSSHLNGRVTLFTSSDGASWDAQELGIGLHAAMLTEYQGDVLVSTTGVLQGDRVPAYYRVGAEVTGPWMYAAAQERSASNHFAVDPAGGFWSMWLGQNGTVNLARFEDHNAPWPVERHVIADIEPSLGAYGDYVYTLGVGERMYVAWIDLDGDDRELKVSVF